ncbi:MAG: MipA/OmpV family protein [Thiohalomonadales bacterium]
MRFNRYLECVLITVATVISSVSTAAPLEGRIVRDSYNEHAWEFNPQIFIAHPNNPLIGNPEPVSVLDFNLRLSYYGERFFFDDAIGYTLFQNEQYMFNLLASPTEDFILFDKDFFKTGDVPALAGLDSRKMSINGGVELLVDGSWGDIALQIQTDLLGIHTGHIVDIAYAYSFYSGKWVVRPQIGMVWKSDNYVDYYYGVSPSEASAILPAYTANSALNTYFFLETRYQLFPSWNLIAGYYIQKADDSIANSPLLIRDNYEDVYVGIEWIKPFSIQF